MAEKDGGPAYPQGHKWISNGPVPQEIDYGMKCGMTLRDYFAAAALQGMLAGYGLKIPTTPVEPKASGALAWEAASSWAYVYADAMLAARAALSPRQPQLPENK